MLSFLRDVGTAHERLKKRIHAFRLPLTKNGQRVMGLVYFSIPVIGGYYVMKWAERKAEHNLQLEGDQIRSAGGSSAQFVKQQNDELRKMLQEKTK